ncbi:MAG: mandelate racemase/muconate lactonizing enzyme family protein [Anaerolineae bacterium]
MKITRIKLYPIAISRRTGIVNQHVIVRVDAGDSCVGWGEMSDLSHLPMYQFDLPQLECSLNNLLQGKDARNLARIEDDMLRFYPDEGHKYSRAGLVRQGIDLAMHDLLARADCVPVSTLLGGQLRDRIKVCYPIFRLRSVDEVAPNLDCVQEMLDEGFDLIRVYVGANLEADEAFLVRFTDRFEGWVFVKSLDFSNLLGWRQAWRATQQLAQVADFALVESIALEGDLDGMCEYRRRSAWPVSEHVHHIHHDWQFVSRGCVDILNVSPYVLGGLRASLRLIALAEASHTGVLIGTTQELNLGTAAVAHLGAVARVLDYPSDNTGPRLYTDDVVRQPVAYEDGYLLVPSGAGLGVEVDEALLEEKTSAMSWTFGANLAGLLDRTPGGSAPAGEK